MKKFSGKKIDKKWGVYYYYGMKRCYICKEEKETTEFYWENSAKTKLSSKCKKCHNIRKDKKRSSVPVLRLINNLKSRIRETILQYGFDKKHLSNEMLGIDREGLKLYIEKRFRDGMLWDNYGSHWVIDHMMPINEVKTYDDLVRLCHYSNLQPLLVKENSTKGKKLTTESLVKREFPYNEIMIDKENNLVDIKIGDDRGIGFFWSDE